MAKLSLILLMGGLSTVFWGAAFGGWFGLTWHPFMFEPMREPLKMLALCFSLGAAHLAIGIAGEGTSNEWCEKVSDEEYGKLK